MFYTRTPRRLEFDAGHRIPFHESKCRNPHGHRYVLECALYGPVQEVRGETDDGMVLDFGDLKSIMAEAVVDKWDHGFLLYKDDPIVEFMSKASEHFDPYKIILCDFIPTVENMARFAFTAIQARIEEEHARLDRELTCRVEFLRMWETPNCSAIVHYMDFVRAETDEKVVIEALSDLGHKASTE